MKKSRPFKKIKSWVEDRGYRIKITNSDYVEYDDKIVGLYHNSNMIYSALHECGHIIICDRGDFQKDFKSVHRAENIDGRHYRSNIYKYKKLKEEMNAWEEGLKLAKELRIRINKDDYEKYAAKFFMTYVKDFSGV